MRLKVELNLLKGHVITFQFQTGSIKSTAEIAAMLDADPFQFQTGAIKSPQMKHKLEKYSFNSKLVRLKVEYLKEMQGDKRASFNSKLVRLKVLSVAASHIVLVCFNSKLVRLKGMNRDKPVARLKHGFNSKLVRLKEKQ